jgi:restriction system protein
MKLKMSKNSLFAILLRSPWWISLLVVVVFVLASSALLPKDYVPFGIMGSLPFLVIGVIAGWRQWQAPNPARVAEALARAGAMSWRDFASALEQRFVQQGYTVTRLNSTAADFSLSQGGQVTLVSCKRWKAATHGVESLRELVAAKEARQADQCTYISLGAVSDNAQRLATEQGVALVSGDALGVLIMDKNKR